MEKPISVTIQNVPPKFWKAVKFAALAADKGISEFALELMQKALNGRGK